MPASETSPETILDALRLHLETQGNNTVYTFLKSDGDRVSATYRELDTRARQIANGLLDVAEPGDRALMMYPAGLEFIEAFLGCLYAGIVAVPAYPPKKNRNAERIHAIAEDCSPRLLLCSSDTRQNVEGDLAAQIPGSSVIATDAISTSHPASLPQLTSDRLAFLQYTSGSTASPKGVMVSHGNLVANEMLIRQYFEFTQDSVMVSWLPMFHDMGLIGGILAPLYVGFQSVLMAPNTFLRDPIRWWQAVTDFRGTCTGAPNFAYDLCVKAINDDQKQTLDLTSLRIAYNGAEPVRAETLARFSRAFAACGLRAEACFPCYGLAETTLLVSGGPPLTATNIAKLSPPALEQHQIKPDNDGTEIVSCGQITSTLEVRTVNPGTFAETEPDAIGEIWVHGDSVAKGYWNRPDETVESFHARLRTDERDWFRTGDYGFIRDGELYVTGRLKDLIIIHGRNIYPQDIEKAVEGAVDIVGPNSCAAFAIEKGGHEALIVVAEGTRSMARWSKRPDDYRDEIAGLRQQIDGLRSAILEQFELPIANIVFLRPTTFPRTSSGKVQRTLCRQRYLSGELDTLDVLTDSDDAPPSTDALNGTSITQVREDVRAVVAAWAEDENVDVNGFGDNTPFSQLGIDSVAATDLGLRIRRRFGSVIDGEVLLRLGTVTELAHYIVGKSHSIPGDESPSNPRPLISGPADRLDEIDRVFEVSSRNQLTHLTAEDTELDGRTVLVNGRRVINFGSCSYLGLDLDPRLAHAASDSAHRYGTTFSSSRAFVSAPQYEELEHLLTRIFGAYPVICQTTTLAHFSALPVLLEDGDVVILDVHAHQSLRMALSACGRDVLVKVAPHADVGFVADVAREHIRSRVWYVTDGIFSMHADKTPRDELYALLEDHSNVYAYVDDAHGMSAFGERGQGYVLGDSRPQHPRMVVAVSLGKAFAAGAGGVVVCPNEEWQQKIRTCGPTMIFSGPIPPASLGAAVASARIHLTSEIQDLQAELRELCTKFASLAREHGLEVFGHDDVPIKYIRLGNASDAAKAVSLLLDRGFFANICSYPAVPENESGVRAMVTRHHSLEDIRALIGTLKDAHSAASRGSES